MIDYKKELTKMGQNALKSFRKFTSFNTNQKNFCLQTIAKAIRDNTTVIKEANAKDLILAKKNNLSSALINRLILTNECIEAMAKGVEDIILLQDPIGIIDKKFTQKDGLIISKQHTPIGVISIIYESRPNVTIDAAVLCLKAGNAVILRGGKEAFQSNQILIKILIEASKIAGIPDNLIQFIPWIDKEAIKPLLTLDKYISLIIPRGGENLIRTVVENTTIPVIKHNKGLCHIYIDKEANIQMAESIIINAKCQRPSVCNALETLLIHKDIAKKIIPKLAEKLRKNGVELRGDEMYCSYDKQANKASEDDWHCEYLDLILSIKIVQDTNQAIKHINNYGSGHSDAIISNDKIQQDNFTLLVDSATVYINASTRFTDGASFGFGAEIGISTDKLHARGPMALMELTTYKYIILGNGQIRK